MSDIKITRKTSKIDRLRLGKLFQHQTTAVLKETKRQKYFLWRKQLVIIKIKEDETSMNKTKFPFSTHSE